MPYLSILAGDYEDALLGRSFLKRAQSAASKALAPRGPMPSPFRRALNPLTAHKIAMNLGRKTHAAGQRAQRYAPRPAGFGHSPLFGAEQFQLSGYFDDELLGKSFLKRVVKKTTKIVKGTTLAPIKLVTRPVKTFKQAAKFTAKNPLLTNIVTGGAAAPLLLATKKGRAAIKHTAGNVAAYGLAPVTGGASLLGKKSVRSFAKRHPFMTAALSPASLGYTLGTKKGRAVASKTTGNVAAYGLAPLTGGLSLLGKKNVRQFAGRQLKTVGRVAGKVGRGVGGFVAQTAREVMKQENPAEDTQDSGAPGPEDTAKKKSLVLPLGIGAALLAFL